MTKKWLAIAALSICLAAPAQAGWVIVQQGAGETMEHMAEDNLMKVVTPEQQVVMDVNRGLMIFIDPAKKTYWQGTPEEFYNQTIGKAMSALDEQLKDLPPEQQKAMKAMMQQAMGGNTPGTQAPSVQVKSMGPGEKIAGFSTQKYQVLVDGQLDEEVWISKDIPIADEIDVDKLVKMMEPLTKGMGGQVMAEMHPARMNLYRQGMPVKEISHDMGGKTVYEIVKAEQKSLGKSAFLPPSEYRQVGLQEMFGPMGQ